MTDAHTAAGAPMDPSLLDLRAVTHALRPFGESTMLPADAYTSADVLAWEQRHFFAGTWTCIGREQDLREGAVRQRALVVGDVPVLLIWTDEGAPSAFANTCRHRGHELLAAGESSPNRSVVCPYHAWSYALDGSLRAAPGFRESATFEPDEHSLVELPLETWHGWVFVHALRPSDEGPAVPFAEHIGDLESVIGPYAPELLHLGARHTYTVAANWKVVAENYHECYHCPLIHPELCQVSPPTSGDNYHLAGAWAGGSMELRDGAETMSLSGQSGGRSIAGVDPGRVEYVGLLPNLLVSAHPDYVMTHRLLPQAPDRTWIECSWYFVDPATDPTYAVEFWDITNRQDWAACESVQRGLASPHFRPGPLAPNEDAVHQFVSMVGRGYLGQPLHQAGTSALAR